VSSDRLAGPMFDDLAGVRRALPEGAVGPVAVVVRDVVVQEL